MSNAIAVYHGAFGRVTLYHLTKPMIKHAHREGHLVFWVQGATGRFTMKGVPCPISPESGAAANSWELHQYDPDDEINGQYVLVLYIKPSWFLNFSRSSTSALKFGRPEIEMNGPIKSLVAKITSLLADGNGTDLLDGYLYELTSESFAQSHQWLSGSHTVDLSPRINDFRIRKSIKLMSECVGEEVDLDKVAVESGLSRPHFFKLFRTQIGVTPKLYWNTIRMEQALDQLAESPKSITDISFDLGFSSQSSFSRFFAMNTGLAPTDYRRVAHVLHS